MPARPSGDAQGRKGDRRIPCPAIPAQGICRGQRADLSDAPNRTRDAVARGKKTAEAIRQEVAREVDQFLRVIFSGRRKSGHLDLEAIEMAVRSAMHHAGATALSELLQFPAPATEQRTLPCACGHQASYRELRSKPVLTAVGAVKVSRPYYLCSHCLPASSRPTSNWTSKIR